MLQVNTSGMSITNIAEKIVEDLALSTLPLVYKYLIELLDSVQRDAPLQDAYYNLQHKFDCLQEDYNYLNKTHKDAEVAFYKSELSKSNFEASLSLIDWSVLCEKHPHNKIDMIKEIRTLTGCGLKDAKVLCDTHVLLGENGNYKPEASNA